MVFNFLTGLAIGCFVGALVPPVAKFCAKQFGWVKNKVDP